MLFVHEVHRVVGAREEAFESAYRDGWLPQLAKTDDARLLYFLHHAHGSGRAYVAVTITALRDGDAYERLVERVQTGDLREWAAEVDRARHEVAGKLLVQVPWSPLQGFDLASVPTDGGDHELSLFMEDTAWPHEAMLDAYLDAARSHYAPSLEEGRHSGRALLDLQAVFQSAWGAGRRREVVLWQKVIEPQRITGLLTTEIPLEHRAPGTWMHDALRVRDDWESRLLRTSSWSPLY
jgi:hypothetical protein